MNKNKMNKNSNNNNNNNNNTSSNKKQQQQHPDFFSAGLLIVISFSTWFSFWSNSPTTFQGAELLVSFIGMYPYTSTHLLRRYLDPQNIPKTPSQEVFGCLGYFSFDSPPKEQTVSLFLLGTNEYLHLLVWWLEKYSPNGGLRVI